MVCAPCHWQYFAFGEPIETAHFGGDWESLAKCTEVYTRVKGEVEKLIQRLQVTHSYLMFRYYSVEISTWFNGGISWTLRALRLRPGFE